MPTFVRFKKNPTILPFADPGFGSRNKVILSFVPMSLMSWTHTTTDSPSMVVTEFKGKANVRFCAARKPDWVGIV